MVCIDKSGARWVHQPLPARVDAISGKVAPALGSALQINPTTKQIEVANADISRFASSIRPVAIFTSNPALPDANYPTGTFGKNVTTGAFLRVNAAGNAWEAAVNGATDVQANSITADRINTASLAAAFATITYLTSNYITASAISAAYATLSYLTSNYATITALNAKTISADNITTGTMVGSNVTVSGSAGSAVLDATLGGIYQNGSLYRVRMESGTLVVELIGGTHMPRVEIGPYGITCRDASGNPVATMSYDGTGHFTNMYTKTEVDNLLAGKAAHGVYSAAGGIVTI
jgi:hypothetical protein